MDYTPKNEAVLLYEQGSPERVALEKMLDELYAEEREIFMHIDGKKVASSRQVDIYPPHKHQHKIGCCHYGDGGHVAQAIQAALDAKPAWASLSLAERSAIFLRAADLLSKEWRIKMVAATMIGQSKSVMQAELDAACQLIDYLRFSVAYAVQIYQEKVASTSTVHNVLEYRPLEGFVFAITPFNFTSIAVNLAFAPALMGNTVVWKPADSQIYAASFCMELLEEAGLPKGVINLVFSDGEEAGEQIFNHKDFAGLHFTGSTKVFQQLWKLTSQKLDVYKNYPRIVGETGGKDFVIAHPSANMDKLSISLIRGAFEFQGQKCSAASRAYIPKSLWASLKERLIQALEMMKVGAVEDFSCFMNAVIDKKAFEKITHYIKIAKEEGVTCIAGGKADASKGYFIEPTIFLTDDPMATTMVEEIFGPVLTIYLYDDEDFEETLSLVNNTSIYGLTGAIISEDKEAAERAQKSLMYAAGNFYVNDKPTGGVIGQQPFGGARASGTNDKAGSIWNLMRWVSPRSIKHNLTTPTDWSYPYMSDGGKG